MEADLFDGQPLTNHLSGSRLPLMGADATVTKESAMDQICAELDTVFNLGEIVRF